MIECSEGSRVFAPVQPVVGLLWRQDCKPTDACIGNGGYCIRNNHKEDCDSLLFPKECRSPIGSCCVQDINECDSDPCGPGMRCQNTLRSYECICDAGFEKVDGTCVDINECNSSTPICPDGEKCTNTDGSYTCGCQMCSPQCEQGGLFVFDSLCVRLSKSPGGLMTYEEAILSCGYPYLLAPIATQEELDIIGSQVLQNFSTAAWVGPTPTQQPNVNGLCPYISRSGGSFGFESFGCNTPVSTAICQTRRLW